MRWCVMASELMSHDTTCSRNVPQQRCTLLLCRTLLDSSAAADSDQCLLLAGVVLKRWFHPITAPHAAFAESDEQAITREAFQYLHQHGYINTGVLKGEQSLAAETPIKQEPEADAAGGLSDYELAVKTFAILRTSDMEVNTLLSPCCSDH